MEWKTSNLQLLLHYNCLKTPRCFYKYCTKAVFISTYTHPQQKWNNSTQANVKLHYTPVYDNYLPMWFHYYDHMTIPSLNTSLLKSMAHSPFWKRSTKGWTVVFLHPIFNLVFQDDKGILVGNPPPKYPFSWHTGCKRLFSTNVRKH